MNAKKKILFLVTQSEFGGAQRFIYNLIIALRRDTQIGPDLRRDTQIDADKKEFLYSDITYKIRGACFKIWKEFRGAFKEKIIERALAKELQNQGLRVDTQKQISVLYNSEKMGEYIPDMIIDDKVLLELKSKTFLTKEDEKQFWLYLKGSEYRLGLLINFGKKLEIKRKVYDTAREKSASVSVLPKAVNQRVSANYEVVVGAGPDGDDEKGLLSLLEAKGINTIHLRYLRRLINPFFDILGLFEIKNLIKRERPDILFLCSSKAGFLGSLAVRRCTQIASEQSSEYADTRRKNSVLISVLPKAQNQRVSAKSPKVIYRIGGWTFNDPWPKWKKSLYVRIEKWSAKFKDIIINNAESDRKQAIKLGIKPKDKIITIYNGIGNLEFLSKEKAREFLELKESDFVVGTIANNYPAKGLKYLRKAVNILNRRYTRIDLASQDTQRHAENYQRKSAYPEGQNQRSSAFIKLVIIGKGNRYIPDAYKYLKAFDVFVLPSVKEGFPWTLLEAIRADIPIVATCVGAVPEIIDYCIEPKNIEELIKAIKNPKKFKLNKKFTLEIMIKKYEDLFSIN